MARRAITVVIGQLEAAGMELCGTFLGSPVLKLSSDKKSDYIRFFSPQFISKNGGKAVVGLLGSMKKEVIDDWGNFNRIADYFVLSAFSANFSNLRDPPVFGISPEEDTEWCKRIVEVLQSFPSTQQELGQMKVDNSFIHGFEVGKML